MNDHQLSFLHNILSRSSTNQLQKNETNSSAKSVSHRMSPVNFVQVKKSKKAAENRQFDLLKPKPRSKKLIKLHKSTNKQVQPSSLIKQQQQPEHPKKIDPIIYVFDQRNSFYPARIPIKYGFQIRPLIENNRLPSWKFSKHDKNQIIYQSSIHQNPSNRTNPIFTSPSLTSTIPKYPSSIDSEIQHRWIYSLLNSSQSKGQDRQLSSVVHQYSHSSPIPTTTATEKASTEKLLSPRKCSDKPQSKIKRRTRHITFEEHLQRYYLSKWCLTYTRNFHDHQLIKP